MRAARSAGRPTVKAGLLRAGNRVGNRAADRLRRAADRTRRLLRRGAARSLRRRFRRVGFPIRRRVSGAARPYPRIDHGSCAERNRLAGKASGFMSEATARRARGGARRSAQVGVPATAGGPPPVSPDRVIQVCERTRSVLWHAGCSAPRRTGRPPCDSGRRASAPSLGQLSSVRWCSRVKRVSASHGRLNVHDSGEARTGREAARVVRREDVTGRETPRASARKWSRPLRGRPAARPCGHPRRERRQARLSASRV